MPKYDFKKLAALWAAHPELPLKKAKHGVMTPGLYLSGCTHWWACTMHVGLLDTWTNVHFK